MDHAYDGDATSGWREVTELSFSGPRFVEHAIEIDVVRELWTFQAMVSELATELWRAQHPNRERVPKGFERSTRLRFRTIRAGSTVIPIEAPTAEENPLFGDGVAPVVEHALAIIWASIRSQQDGRDLPADLPRSTTLPTLAQWGSTLEPDEAISVGEPGDTDERLNEPRRAATLSLDTRARLATYVESYYEDTLTVYGHIRAVDRDRNTATLRLPNATRLRIGYLPRLEEAFARALQASRSVAVTGLARVSSEDGFLQRMASVTEIAVVPDGGTTAPLDWLEREALAIDWSSVPTDLARNLDAHLYGKKRP